MSSKATRRYIVFGAVVTVLLAAIVVAAFYLFSGPTGPSKTARRLAAMLPAETPLLLWSADLATVIDLGKEAGLDGHVLAERHEGYGQFVQSINANPLTEEGLKGLGIDAGRGVGVALYPSAKAGLIVAVYVPLLPGVDAVERLEELLASLGVSESIVIDRSDRTSWLFPVSGGERDPRGMGIVGVDDGCFVLLATADSRDEGAAATADLKAYAETLLAVSDHSLASAPAFAQAYPAARSPWIAGFFNPGESAPKWTLGEAGLTLGLRVLASAQGAGFALSEEGRQLRFDLRTVLAGEGLAAGRERDLGVLSIIPGHPAAGLHLAIDLERALAELNRSMSPSEFTSSPLVSRLMTLGPFGLADQVKVADLLNGELGLFLGDVGAGIEGLAASSVAFVGAGPELTPDALETMVRHLASDVTRKEVSGATIYGFDLLGMPAAAVLHGGRLWLAGSIDTLEAIAAGEPGHLMSGDRNRTVASVMGDAGMLAGFVDVARIADALPALGAPSMAEMGPGGTLLGTIDSLTLHAANEGTLVDGRLVVASKGESFRRTTLSALLGAIDGSFGAVRERRREVAHAATQARQNAWQGEAQHILHRAYTGAANYFETPLYDEAGNPIPCQFPKGAPVTPERDCCSYEGGLCPADESVWTRSETWSALNVSHASLQYCNYSFESEGTGPDATFTVTAYCDHDCDGQADVWKMHGKAGATSTETFCEMSGDRRFEKLP